MRVGIGSLVAVAIGCIVIACSQPTPIVADPASQSYDATVEPTAPPPEAPSKPDPCARIAGVGCYWMENTTGNYCWVPTPTGPATTKAECFDLDSCDGGNAQSGGGCYKWAECSHCARAPW